MSTLYTVLFLELFGRRDNSSSYPVESNDDYLRFRFYHREENVTRILTGPINLELKMEADLRVLVSW
jgi:hypothetical protein